MVLMLTDEELCLCRTALRNYSVSLRDEARVYCSGYSPKGITLCQRRMQVDLLLDGLETQHAPGKQARNAQDGALSPHEPYIVRAA
jgi:hypothetical protein